MPGCTADTVPGTCIYQIMHAASQLDQLCHHCLHASELQVQHLLQEQLLLVALKLLSYGAYGAYPLLLSLGAGKSTVLLVR